MKNVINNAGTINIRTLFIIIDGVKQRAHIHVHTYVPYIHKRKTEGYFFIVFPSCFPHSTSLILTQMLPNLSSNDVLLQVEGVGGRRSGSEKMGRKWVAFGRLVVRRKTES